MPRRWNRLVDAGEGSRQPLVPVAIFIVAIIAYLLVVPWALDHVDETKRFVCPTAKRAFVLFSAGVGVACVVASIMVFLTGIGAVGVPVRQAGGTRAGR